jgi:hypothetical protein
MIIGAKVGRKSHDIRIFRRIVGVQSTEQSVLSCLTITSCESLRDRIGGVYEYSNWYPWLW